METVADLTMADLKRFVEDTIDERLARLLGSFEVNDEDGADEVLSWDTIRASVERYRWTPPPGAKTSLELLREDRDS